MSSFLGWSRTEGQREKREKLTRRRRFLVGCPVTSEHPSPFFQSWTAAVESWQQTTFNKTLLLGSTEHLRITFYVSMVTRCYRSPFWTTRFLQVLQQEQAWLHSKMKGGSSEQNSGSRRLSWGRRHETRESCACYHVRHDFSDFRF